MAQKTFSNWIGEKHSRFQSLTDTVVLTMTRLLTDAGIAYLTISGRTKSLDDCQSKIRRKKYKDPINQLTDISGVRVVVYFDYDVEAVCRLIESNFSVDMANSSNRDEVLSVNEVGYRSVHYVCDLGRERVALQEHRALANLKFEFQIRTVLQHAWAELAHDRNYKFSGQLPKQLERKLFLLAGLMETADNGFSELSREVDKYAVEIKESTAVGDLEIELNAISVDQFVKQWGLENGIQIGEVKNRDQYDDLLRELKQYGIKNLRELSASIPNDFLEKSGINYGTVLGLVRDWMIISDPYRFVRDVDVDWVISRSEFDKYDRFLDLNQLTALEAGLRVIEEDDVDVERWFEEVRD